MARAFNRVYGLRLTVRGEMEVAYQGERLTPSMCGRMDQVHAFATVLKLCTTCDLGSIGSARYLWIAQSPTTEGWFQASAFGSVPLLLTFRGETVAVDRLLLGAPLYLVLVDLMCARVSNACWDNLQRKLFTSGIWARLFICSKYFCSVM